MILKNSHQALEPTSLAKASLIDFLLKRKILGLQSGRMIPDKLISELEEFVNRNLLINDKKGSFCPRCLKAHASNKANELGLDPNSLEFFGTLFIGDLGHNGYYLDEGDLVKIELKGGFRNQ